MVFFTTNLCVDLYAWGSQEIQGLNLQLPILCPEITTTMTTVFETTTTISTTSHAEQCSLGCSIKIESLEENLLAKSEELSRENAEQDLRISQLQDELRLAKNDYDDRIDELEKKLRELASSPCSPCQMK